MERPVQFLNNKRGNNAGPCPVSLLIFSVALWCWVCHSSTRRNHRQGSCRCLLTGDARRLFERRHLCLYSEMSTFYFMLEGITFRTFSKQSKCLYIVISGDLMYSEICSGFLSAYLFILPVSCVRSAYQVVVEEERPRRARGTAEILRCYPVPIHFQNATLLNSQYYFTAQFPAAGIHSPQPFTVGDNKTYNGYWNAPLLPQKSYSIYYQAVSTANGVGVLKLHFSYVTRLNAHVKYPNSAGMWSSHSPSSAASFP